MNDNLQAIWNVSYLGMQATTFMNVDLPATGTVTDVNGNIYYIKPSASNFPFPTSYINNNMSSAGWKFGSGNTGVSDSDYRLVNYIDNSKINATIGNPYVYAYGTDKLIFKHVITITALDDIEINEVGLTISLPTYTSYDGATATSKRILIHREVIETIQMEANDTAVIQITYWSDRS